MNSVIMEHHLGTLGIRRTPPAAVFNSGKQGTTAHTVVRLAL